MVYVYATDVTDLPDPLEHLELMEGLSEERKEKICRYRQLRDRKLSLGAGLLLKESLLLHGFSAEHITYGEHGKPEAAGIYFNLSHSHDVVVCAISAREVGCDVEKIKKVRENIAEHYFTESEIAHLQAFHEKDRRNEFFRIWTLKESYLKMTGEGMNLALNQFEFLFSEEVKVLRDGKLQACFIKEYPLPGYKLSVCAREAEFSQLRFLKYQNR